MLARYILSVVFFFPSSFLLFTTPPPQQNIYTECIFLGFLYSLCNLQEYFLWCFPPGGSQGPECGNYMVHLPTTRICDHRWHCRKLNYVLIACTQSEKTTRKRDKYLHPLGKKKTNPHNQTAKRSCNDSENTLLLNTQYSRSA